MNFNNLVVTVISARGLSLKGHSKLEVFVNLTVSGKGNWKSKVQTDVIKTTADCKWDQRCEFTLNDLDSTLIVTVNHRTVLGTADCIGSLELPLRQLTQVHMPTWYRLCKKGKHGDNGQQKYRGEICLKYEFSNKICTEATHNLSASSFSIGTPRATSKLDTLKRKMHIGKKQHDISDTASLISLPQYSRRGSALCEVCPTFPRASISDLNKDGLITPPAAATNAHHSTLLHISGNTGAAPGSDGIFRYNQSRRTSLSSNRNSLNSSPVLTVGEVEGLDSPTVIPRPRSVASSGFGSGRSTVISGPDATSICRYPSRDELLKNINDLRMELARKDAKIYDLQDYIGKLLVRVMEKDPELLEVPPPRTVFQK